MTESSPILRRATKAHFFWYVSSSSLWMAAITLEGLLISWILLGYLDESAAVYGNSRALISLSPLIPLILGGVWADRVSAKRILLLLTLIASLAPLMLLSVLSQLNVYIVIVFGTVIALLQGFGDPARQAIVNRVTPIDIQRTIVVITVIPSLVGMCLLQIGSKLETLGLAVMLGLMSATMIASAFAIFGLPNLDPVRTERVNLLAGMKVFWKTPLVRDVINMNFISAIFNAGGYIVAMPIIALRVYEGEVELLSLMMIVFLIGSTGSNVLLFFVMPLKHPGKVYVFMQLTRAVIILGFLFEPPVFVFLFLIGCWGVNMGVTSTLARTTVQEQAPAEHRAKLLSFFLFGFMLASPISSFLLGQLIQYTNPLIGLAPGLGLSLLLFFWGRFGSELWHYQAPISLR